MAPRIEILNILACERLKSEYHLQTSYTQIFGEDVFNMPGLHALTKSPPNNTQYVATPNSVYLDNSRIVVMTPNLDECKKDPDVQRAVAKVTTGKFHSFVEGELCSCWKSSSHDHHVGCTWGDYGWMVGICVY